MAWRRQRLFEALARAILIRREPLLLFLDDVQWCDRETLDWLHYSEVAREVGDRQGLARALRAAAYVFAGRGDFQRALAYNMHAWPILVEIGDKWSMCVGINDIGRMVKRLDYAQQAEESHRLAIALGKAILRKITSCDGNEDGISQFSFLQPA